MKLSASDLVPIAASAGFSGADLATAVAVALAESGGDPQAFNPEGSYGLWQIYVNAHPEFANDNLYDPATNAADAFQVYRNAGFNFTPWSAFKNGSYAQFMAPAQSAVAALMNTVSPSTVPTVVQTVDQAGNIVFVPAGGQTAQLPGWVWIAAAAVGLVIFMQD